MRGCFNNKNYRGIFKPEKNRFAQQEQKNDKNEIAQRKNITMKINAHNNKN